MITIKDLSEKYLVWCGKHRAPRSCEWYEGHIKQFMTYMGENSSIDAEKIKPFHLVEWVDSNPKWGNTYKRSGMIAIQRVLSWGIQMGHVTTNPLVGLKKPTADSRNNHMKPEDFDNIVSKLRHNDSFKDILLFCWHSGCRPQEARHIEPRHVNLVDGVITFPREESKGQRRKRVIYLHEITLEIMTRLMSQGREGKLFLNNRGTPWTKWALCNRMHRLSKMTGKRMAMYDARHGFATRKLIQGHDHLTIAALMGHRDGSMLAKVYSHIDKDVVYLRKALEE